MHYAVLGAAGQLGRELMARLPADVTIGWTRGDADLAVRGQIAHLVATHRPRVVLNCAAYNLVDKAEDEPHVALAINALGVRELAQACRDIDATLVHFSTDYVFGLEATRQQPYRESDVPGPLGAYGLSKLAGEYVVRSVCPKHLVLRTCGLYGKHGAGGKGGNFVETMLKLAQGGKTIRVVDDQILTPSSAADVASATKQLLEQNAQGLYHVTNAGQCSWFDFASALFRLAGVKADVQPISTREYGSKAPRPAYSVLATEHPQAPRLRPWQEALAGYLQQR